MVGALMAQELLARDPSVGLVFIVVATTPQLEEKVTRWGEAALRLGKPTALLLTPGSLVDGARCALREIGCPFTNRMDDALRVIKTAIDYGRALRVHDDPGAAPAYCAQVAAQLEVLPAGRLTEPEVKRLLRLAGVASSTDTVAATADEAVAAAEKTGYPIVLKAVCRDLVHKSDIGAVRLSLHDAQSVRAAWNEISAAVRCHLPHSPFEGCVVQSMTSGGIEMVIGTKWDAQFGPVVMVGASGVLVELLHDVQLALAPVAMPTARALVENLRAAALLMGVRGQPSADVKALVDAVVRFGWIAATLGPRLIELDVNPLLDRGRGVIALDGRATLAHAEFSRRLTK